MTGNVVKSVVAVLACVVLGKAENQASYGEILNV